MSFPRIPPLAPSMVGEAGCSWGDRLQAHEDAGGVQVPARGTKVLSRQKFRSIIERVVNAAVISLHHRRKIFRDRRRIGNFSRRQIRDRLLVRRLRYSGREVGNWLRLRIRCRVWGNGRHGAVLSMAPIHLWRSLFLMTLVNDSDHENAGFLGCTDERSSCICRRRLAVQRLQTCLYRDVPPHRRARMRTGLLQRLPPTSPICIFQSARDQHQRRECSESVGDYE